MNSSRGLPSNKAPSSWLSLKPQQCAIIWSRRSCAQSSTVPMSSKPLVDVQNSTDNRQITIDKVGVRGVRHPIRVRDQANDFQHTIGDFTLTVELPHNFKGTHMSRFLEALNENKGEISAESIPNLIQSLKERLHAERAHVVVQFPYFMTKAAPVTGKTGMMDYQVKFDANCAGDFILQVQVPVTTLCPCSKEISDYGAHNQRGLVTANIRMSEMIWIEEVVHMIESCASCDLYPVLKRPDEKWVTERAYNNPRFVEDMVREVAMVFDKDSRITWYSIEVENFESIHAHNAYAFLERQK
jgi:GTP cyclohydrolase I